MPFDPKVIIPLAFSSYLNVYTILETFHRQFIFHLHISIIFADEYRHSTWILTNLLIPLFIGPSIWWSILLFYSFKGKATLISPSSKNVTPKPEVDHHSILHLWPPTPFTNIKLITWSSLIFSVNLDICWLWDFETLRWWLQMIATCNKKSQNVDATSN